jgi:ribose transport system permease protein
MPLCKKCGKTFDEDSSFCAYCGAPAATIEPSANGTKPPIYNAPPFSGRPMAAPGRNTFINSYLVTVVLVVLFLGFLRFGIATTGGHLFMSRNLGRIFTQICLLGPIAFAATISTRAKGPDFSIGSVMALSSAIIGITCYSNGSPVLGIVISLLVCAVIGLFNGAFITYLRAPAVIVTLLTGVIVRGIMNVLLDGRILPVSESIMAISGYRVGELSLGGIIILIITFIAAFLMIMLTRLGVPTYKRVKKPALSYMFAYMASALFASVAGIFMASRLGAASPIAGTGYEPFIVLVFACVAGSRVMDNRFAPAVYAIAPLLLYATFGNILSMIGLNVFWQTVFGVILAVMILAVAFLSRRFSTSYSDD